MNLNIWKKRALESLIIGTVRQDNLYVIYMKTKCGTIVLNLETSLVVDFSLMAGLVKNLTIERDYKYMYILF